eukprot:4475200-Lingulodinium_polyedra.AAC.1
MPTLRPDEENVPNGTTHPDNIGNLRLIGRRGAKMQNGGNGPTNRPANGARAVAANDIVTSRP